MKDGKNNSYESYHCQHSTTIRICSGQCRLGTLMAWCHLSNCATSLLPLDQPVPLLDPSGRQAEDHNSVPVSQKITTKQAIYIFSKPVALLNTGGSGHIVPGVCITLPKSYKYNSHRQTPKHLDIFVHALKIIQNLIRVEEYDKQH